jgi:catechol 2,3-dioxygenase-like lactoylglutathione lyase family enzyme
MLVSSLGYVALDVADLDQATAMFAGPGQLQINGRTDDRVFLGSAGDHHWVELRHRPGQPQGLAKMAFKADPGTTLDDIEKALRNAGVATTREGDLRSDHVRDAVRFADPDGTEVEIFTGMVSIPGAAQPKWARLERLVHVAVGCADFDKSLEFYTSVLGLGVSDFIEDTTAFMHASDGAHHSLVLQRRPGVRRAVDHICFQTETFDDVMRARAVVRRAGLEMRDDLIRHQTSGSIGFYFEGLPPGLGIEFCFEHGHVIPGQHTPRTFVRTLQAKDVYEPPAGF